ncbi:MAG: hypothetical protein M3N07_01030 [Pseudomonadota bacterium]|nr:hypothetical protein [Pseudomonadota bacterium]
MRRSSSALFLLGALALGGCATSPLEAVLGQVLGGSRDHRGSSDFQQAAVDACGRHASQYGRVSIQDVRQQSRDTLRVYGVVSTNHGNRNFQCSFRSDGRITDFDI